MRSIRSLFIIPLLLFQCTAQKESTMADNSKNRLQHSSSPYLLQHADNPVDWYPWGEEALKKAQKEDKPILVSIGYSSCHWCHVMAHESFEDTAVAKIMNEHFVSIKVDREERPDVDQIYMNAVQSMGINGGWPLNVFLTPDQKPFYGGTYFPKENWTRLLTSISDAFENKRDELNASADQLADALNRNVSDLYRLDEESDITRDALIEGYYRLAPKFDKKWGGIDKEPKFPMPSTWNYLNRIYALTRNEDILEHLQLTLDKIADGGIYDHVGGGFARYSVDGEWHVPHFEKMLYDNGQLLGLYATLYKRTKSEKYRQVILETIDWMKREMLDKTGGLYAALDADSEGEEGKFYVWTYDEVVTVAGDNANIITDYYDVTKNGNWEHTNVLRIVDSEDVIAKKHNFSVDQLKSIVVDFKKKALEKRSERIRPGLDNKIISGWNGLVLTGLLQSYQALGDPAILQLARSNYDFLVANMVKDDKLMHVYRLPTQGFADDYSAVIQALVNYYETVFDEEALVLARKLTDQMIEQFYDEEENLFFYTSDQSEKLIARNTELFDNVIPSSNSMMAENLWKLGTHLDVQSYKDISSLMVRQVMDLVSGEAEYMSNWGSVASLMVSPMPEIAIVGEKAYEIAGQINALPISGKVIMATTEESKLPLLEYKTAMDGKTTIYVCFNKTCKLPVTSIDEALKQIPSDRL